MKKFNRRYYEFWRVPAVLRSGGSRIIALLVIKLCRRYGQMSQSSGAPEYWSTVLWYSNMKYRQVRRYSNTGVFLSSNTKQWYSYKYSAIGRSFRNKTLKLDLYGSGRFLRDLTLVKRYSDSNNMVGSHSTKNWPKMPKCQIRS